MAHTLSKMADFLSRTNRVDAVCGERCLGSRSLAYNKKWETLEKTKEFLCISLVNFSIPIVSLILLEITIVT